MKKYFT